MFCGTEADLILIQETHSCESDAKFWNAQWGNVAYFSHGSNYSAGMWILLHKFKVEVLQTMHSEDGRWLALVKLDNL